jgi:hypothetical protein
MQEPGKVAASEKVSAGMPGNRPQCPQGGESVALVLPPVIGDSLFCMVIAHNLLRNGRRVAVFGDHIYALRQWFPGMDIRPALDRAKAPEILAGFDVVAAKAWHNPRDLEAAGRRLVDLDRVQYLSKQKSMLSRFLDYCSQNLGLSEVVADNGMRPYAGAGTHRVHRRRVALHTGASTPDKRWLPAKFLELALRLRQRGYEPYFVIAPPERAAWEHLSAYALPQVNFATLGELAPWLYQCGWFIGNDSGIGHLASNLGVPTLSLFMRKGSARSWRPCFGPGATVVAGSWLPVGKLRERWWKQLMSVRRVLTAFARLQAAADPGGAQCKQW